MGGQTEREKLVFNVQYLSFSMVYIFPPRLISNYHEVGKDGARRHL